jgi:putative copper resistance protein D
VAPPEGFFARLQTVREVSAAAALAGAVAVLLATAAEMVGEASAAFDPETLATVVTATGFGQVWAARLLLGALLLALVVQGRADVRVVAALSAVFLGSVALTGHAAAQPGPEGWPHRAADAAHLLAAGAWMGALVPLAWLALRRSESEGAREAMIRFSGMGYLAVATLVLTGVVNTWTTLGPPWKLFDTAYGRLLSVKLALFAVMLGLAAANRTRLVPRLKGEPRAAAMARLGRHVAAEQGLGLLVVAVVAVLGTIDPSA